jgi:RNA polymerase sigma-70 factor (ECF subfamily)
VTLHNSEFELVSALSKGDIKAFNSLFQLFGKRLYGFAYGFLKSKPDAEELVQEVFMKVWEKRAELKEHLSFRGYIFTIAFNIIRKHFLKVALTNKYFEQQIFIDIDQSTIQDIDFQSTKKKIDAIIDQLPERRKAVFIKNRFEGYSVKEIAEEFGTSPKTVENQLGEALKFVKDNLRKEDFAILLLFHLFYF